MAVERGGQEVIRFLLLLLHQLVPDTPPQRADVEHMDHTVKHRHANQMERGLDLILYHLHLRQAREPCTRQQLLRVERMEPIVKPSHVFLMEHGVGVIPLHPLPLRTLVPCIQYHRAHHVPAKLKHVNQMERGQEPTRTHLVRWIPARE